MNDNLHFTTKKFSYFYLHYLSKYVILIKRGEVSMEKAYKFRIYPNKTQEILIQKTFGCVRFVYNYFLDKRITAYREDKVTLTYNKCSKELTRLKQELTWLKEPDKCSLQNALKHLDRAFQNFFNRGNVGYPKFKSKKNRHKSYKTNFNNNNIAFEGSKIKLPKLGKVRIRDKQIPQGRILNATVSQTPSGKYFVSICCTDVEKPDFIRTDKYVGIDLGIKDFVITSDGDRYSNPKYLKQSLNKLAKLQRELSRKTRGGSNWDKARIKVARLYERITNQRKDMLNKLSSELVRKYDVICIEDLQVSNMIKNHNLAQSISDASWSEFVRQLEYKSKWYGKELIKVDRFFPSSQTCNVCGYINKATKNLAVRAWICPNCNAKHDRDINASINILHEGMRTVGTTGIAW